MSSWLPRRMTDGVGVVTLALGTALVVAPARTSVALGLGPDAVLARRLGLVDLALAPGLLRAANRWPWMGARAGFNVVLAGCYAAEARRSGGDRRAAAGVVAMLSLTVVDGGLALMLRRTGRHDRKA